MKIAIGADHGGFVHKQQIIELLKNEGYIIVDCGCFDSESCDYPDYAMEVAKLVSKGTCERGILICRTGLGMAVVANKFKNIRAVNCFNEKTAELAGQHLNANILTLAGDFFDTETLFKLIKIWLNAKFQQGRHLRRIEKIKKIEKMNMK